MLNFTESDAQKYAEVLKTNLTTQQRRVFTANVVWAKKSPLGTNQIAPEMTEEGLFYMSLLGPLSNLISLFNCPRPPSEYLFTPVSYWNFNRELRSDPSLRKSVTIFSAKGGKSTLNSINPEKEAQEAAFRYTSKPLYRLIFTGRIISTNGHQQPETRIDQLKSKVLPKNNNTNNKQGVIYDWRGEVPEYE